MLINTFHSQLLLTYTVPDFQFKRNYDEISCDVTEHEYKSSAQASLVEDIQQPLKLILVEFS